MNFWKIMVEKHDLYISCGCLLLRNSKRFIQNCHQNATFFGLCFGQIWPSLVQIFGPDDFKMSKIKFLNTWNLLWLLSVVFSGNPNYYIPPSNRKCNVQCMQPKYFVGKRNLQTFCQIKPSLAIFFMNFTRILYQNSKQMVPHGNYGSRIGILMGQPYGKISMVGPLLKATKNSHLYFY